MVNVRKSKTNPVYLSKVHGERKLEGQDELELFQHLHNQMLVSEEGALRIERPKEARVPHQRLREHECQRSICTRRCRACRASVMCVPADTRPRRVDSETASEKLALGQCSSVSSSSACPACPPLASPARHCTLIRNEDTTQRKEDRNVDRIDERL